MDAIITDPRISIIEGADLNKPGSNINTELREVRKAMADTSVPPDALDLLVLLKHMTGFINGRYEDKTRDCPDCLPTLHAITAGNSHIVALLTDLFTPDVDDAERRRVLSKFLRDNNVVAYCYFTEGLMSKVTLDHEPTEEEMEDMIQKVKDGDLERRPQEIAVFKAETLRRAVVYAFALNVLPDGSKDMEAQPAFVHKANKGEDLGDNPPVEFLLDSPTTLH